MTLMVSFLVQLRYLREREKKGPSDADFVSPVNHFMTIDHDLHRQRRKPFDPFFSRMAINTRSWPMLAEKAICLESRIREYKGQGKAVRLDRAFSAFSADCIERICTDDLEPGDGFLDQPDFGPEWYDGMLGLIRNAPILTKFPKALR